MIPPPGCSPITPSASTRRCISDGSTASERSGISGQWSVVSGHWFVSAKVADSGEPWGDLLGFETLLAGLVEAPLGQILGQILLRPAFAIVLGVVVAIAIVPAVPEAAHQTGHRVAQVQRYGIVACLVDRLDRAAVRPPH